jgi:chromosome segregation ATPase
MGYLDAKKDALKALQPVPSSGSGAPTKAGKLPPDKVDVKKVLDEANKAEKDLKAQIDKAKSSLEKHFTDTENVISKAQNNLKQLAAQIKAEDFGLDPKNKDDAERIKKAREILTAGVGEDFDALEEKTNDLDKIEDSLAGLGVD